MTGTGGLAGRAVRQTSLNNHYTPEDVGPGAYIGHQSHKVRPSYAAFSSTKSRTQSAPKNPTPGPGAYGGAAMPKKQAPNNCFANKVPRFAPAAPGSTVFKASSIQDNPGPGAYPTASTLQITGNAKPKQAKRGPAMIVSAARSKPSIPRPSQSYGYLEGENKELVLQLPPEKVYSGLGSDTVGPAAYNPTKKMTQHSTTVTTDFSKSNQTRKLFEPNKTRDNWQPSHANPGPGYYNPRVKTIAQKKRDDEESRNTSNFASAVPMAHESKPKQSLPGPGVYQPYHFSAVEEKYHATPSAVQGFGTTADRKGWQRSMEIPFNTPTNHTTPGPGSYGEKRTAFNKQPRKMLLDEPIGFNATDQRPCIANKQRGHSNPGPGSYLTSTSVGTLSGDLIRKTVGRNGIFGSTTERFFKGDFDKPEEGIVGHNPGPGAYEEPRQTGQVEPRAKRNQTSVFRAAGNRFSRETQARPPNTVKIVGNVANPPVGSYNIPSTFDKAATSKSAPAKPKPFSSTATRFNGKQFMGKISPRTPGPGAYGEEALKASTFTNKPKPKRPMAPPGTLGMDARFKSGANSYKNTNTTSSDLGPGSYQTEGTMKKRSYNITMAQT